MKRVKKVSIAVATVALITTTAHAASGKQKPPVAASYFSQVSAWVFSF